MTAEQILEITVNPRASKTEIISHEGNRLKIKLNSPPVDGAANKELIKFLAKYFKTAKSNIEILRGLKSRNKTVRIN
jgi:uncharacterized protein (TIGR00251 family)